MQWQDDEIHWFSIVNSSVILLFLSGMVAMIMLRILRKDLYRYNQLEQSEEAREEAREETGWKLISGDVFRPPKYAALLAVYVGSGVQVTTHPSIQHTLIPACVHTYTHTHTHTHTNTHTHTHTHQVMVPDAHGGVRRWLAGAWHVMLHNRVRRLGFPVALESGLTAAGNSGAICSHGLARRVCLGYLLQDVQGRRH